MIQGEVDAHGRQKVEHYVTIDLRFIKSAPSEFEAKKKITPYLASRGWKYKLFQGRHAMERLICRPCLRETSIMERDWERKAHGDRGSKLLEFYGALCGE